MPNARKPQEQDKYVLRMPDGMRARIAARAKISKRSMNAEMLYILEQGLTRPEATFEALGPFDQASLLIDQVIGAAIPLQGVLELLREQTENK